MPFSCTHLAWCISRWDTINRFGHFSIQITLIWLDSFETLLLLSLFLTTFWDFEGLLEFHPEWKFWPLFNANNIFLALLKYLTFFNIILVCFQFCKRSVARNRDLSSVSLCIWKKREFLMQFCKWSGLLIILVKLAKKSAYFSIL